MGKKIVIVLGLLFIFLFLNISFGNADTYPLTHITNQSSGVFQDSKHLFSLEDANILIDCSFDEYGYQKNRNVIWADFNIKNLEETSVETTLYFKVKSSDPYPYDNEIIIGFFVNEKGIHPENENYLWTENYKEYDASITKIGDEKYASINFTFKPNQEIALRIRDSFNEFPFFYYLDELDSYRTLKHEKIIIEGYCDAEFNEYYPLKLLSDERGHKTWIWEYSNLNTSNENLKDTIILRESDFKCDPKWVCEKDLSCKGQDIEIATLCYDGCGDYDTKRLDCSKGFFGRLLDRLRNLF